MITLARTPRPTCLAFLGLALAALALLLAAGRAAGGAPVTQVTLTLLQKDSAGLSSRYTIANPNASTASTAHTFFDNAGSTVASYFTSVAAGGSVQVDLADQADIPDGYQGYAIVSADQPITGAILPVVGLTGPLSGEVGQSFAFTASVIPTTTTQPITYAWQATGQPPVTHTSGLSDTLTFTWLNAGTQTITVALSSAAGPLGSAARQFDVTLPPAWYVAPDGSDANSCALPAEPCATLQAAIDKAAAGDQVYVAVGTYTGTDGAVARIDKSLTLSGGWNKEFSAQPARSTLDGQRARMGIAAFADAVHVERFVLHRSLTGISNDGNFVLDDSIVSNNDVYGVRNWQSSQWAQMTVNHSLISRNAGPGIYNGHVATTTLNASAVIGNFGGGIYGDHAGHVILNNSTVAGNASPGSGGGIYAWACASQPEWWSGSVTLNNSTISGNTARYSGGGLAIECATVYARNSLVAGNHAPASPDCDNFSGPFDSLGYNLIGNIAGCSLTLGPGDLVNAGAQLGELLGAPAYLPLLPGSPAIDAGDPAGCAGTAGPLPADQRGAPRVGRCDIGAYEYTLAGSAAGIAAWSGTPQMTAPGAPYPGLLRAAVVDSLGSPVPGAVVIFTAPASGPSGAFAGAGSLTSSATTNTSGLATAAPFTANHQTGGFDVTAVVAGVPDPANFLLGNWYLGLLPLVAR